MTTDTQNLPVPKTNSKPGQPTKCTPQLIEKISSFVAKGNYILTSCQLCGINSKSYYNWIAKAEEAYEQGENDSIYLQFFYSIKRAEAKAESELVGIVRETAIDKKEWLPAMTFLERRHPDRWGRKDRNQVTIDERKTVTITHVEVVKPQGYIDGETRDLLEEGQVDDNVT